MSIRANWVSLLGLVSMVAGGDVLAQQPTDLPSITPRMHTVVAGEHYSAGSVHRFLFGNDYRKLWTAPIQIAELDCSKYGGGLTATRRVGGQQTRGLAFKSVDGRSFTFRGLDKDPSDILPPDYKDTIVDRILQDQIASSLPGGTVAVPPILEAAGVLHAEPFLVVLPDDPALGEHREMFGGLLGTFEEYPVANAERSPGTHGATEIINGEEMWKRMDASAQTRPDSRALLKARLIDILIGDWDRHRGQWRWAQIPGHEKWQPIPEDRDQAFVRFEGLVINAGQIRLPQFVSFGEKYPGIEGLTWNGRDVDRRILVDLEKPVWEEVAAELKAKITDDVIAEAIGRLPAEYQALEGDHLQTALRKRRDGLPQIADEFYRFLARDVDIYGTDADDVVTISSADNGDVRVALSSAESPEYCVRTFHPGETDEIRIYLGGGNDRVESTGSGDDIIVRVLPGNGADVIDAAPEADLRVSDSDSIEVVSAGSSLHLDTRPYTAPVREKAEWIPPRDWGRRNIWYPWISANSDIGFLFLVGWQSEGYGFRHDPYSDRHTVRIGYATKAGGFGGDYRGEFRRENSRSYSELYVRGSGLDFLHFYGFGNETEATEDEDFYKVKQSLYKIEPSYTTPVVGLVMGTIRANVTYAKTKLEGNHLINQVQPYGAEDFLQWGAGAGLSYDTRDSDVAPMRGAHVTIDGTVFPEWSDVVSTFGEVHGEAAYYQPIGILSTPTLAMHAGGKKLWSSTPGEIPYHEAAYIGGTRSVRGFPSQRFAGDASTYGSAELRIPLSRIYVFVPGNLGIFGLYDIGRVYVDGENSDTWHSSYGGGLWATFINTANTASLAVAASEEDTRLYLLAGFAF